MRNDVAAQLADAEAELAAANAAVDAASSRQVGGSSRTMKFVRAVDADIRRSAEAFRRLKLAEDRVSSLRARLESQQRRAAFVPVPVEWLRGADYVRDRDGRYSWVDRVPVGQIAAVACRVERRQER